MTVGIVGLGLIGGSLAKAYQRDESVTVLGEDKDPSILQFAQLAQAVDGELTEKTIPQCDLILLAAYPQAVIDWLTRHAAHIAAHTTVIDCTGTKRRVCETCFPLAAEHGFLFVGGHPMAGTQYSGFKYSRADLFDGAPMVIVPPRFDDIRLLDGVKQLLAPVGFGRVSVATAEDHDQKIAFTSQMAHVISNAYVKSPTAQLHQGFSAGSYKDLTRVAWLNPDMWAELFLENGDLLLEELEIFQKSLAQYQAALEARDYSALRRLLQEGKERKEAVDGL